MVMVYCYCFRQLGSSRAIIRKIGTQHGAAPTCLASSDRNVGNVADEISPMQLVTTT